MCQGSRRGEKRQEIEDITHILGAGRIREEHGISDGGALENGCFELKLLTCLSRGRDDRDAAREITRLECFLVYRYGGLSVYIYTYTYSSRIYGGSLNTGWLMSLAYIQTTASPVAIIVVYAKTRTF